MTKLLIKTFVKNHGETQDIAVRGSYGKLAGVCGIVTNTLVSLLKIVVGLMFGDISVVADGINNLADAGSSVVTLIGFAMSGKPADAEHPFGHARMEYVAGLAVSFIVMFLGLQLLYNSFLKVVNPTLPSFSAVTVVVLVVSVGVKLWQSRFNFKLATAINSKTLFAAATDSRNDVVATSAVLLGVVVGALSGFALDGFIGILVAAFIIKSGIELVRDTINPLLGEHPDEELLREVERKILSYEGVLGVHDIVMHSYGHGRCFTSAHVEMDANQELLKSHEIIDRIEHDITQGMNMYLLLHIDPIANDERTNRLRDSMNGIVSSVSEELSVHDFHTRVYKQRTYLIFDVAVPSTFSMTDIDLRIEIEQAVLCEYEDCSVILTLDRSLLPDMK